MNYKHLNLAQRYAIYLGLTRKASIKSIACENKVSVSTIYREIKRNSKSDGTYMYLIADKRANSRKHGLQGNHRKSDMLWWQVKRLLCEEQWSPEQIAGVMRKEGITICKQTIYNHIHADETGKLAEWLPHKLKYKRRMRRQTITKATNITHRISIHDRPIEANGSRFGDWEMDTIVDSYKHVIVTLVERSTNFMMMKRLPHGRKATFLAKEVVKMLFPYRQHIKTITTDNGCEFAAHLLISKGLKMRGRDAPIVYFTDSYSSWQKGCIENTNKLVRRYIPKKANFNDFSDKFILNVQHKLNNRPRKKLNYMTPKFVYFETIH